MPFILRCNRWIPPAPFIIKTAKSVLCLLCLKLCTLPTSVLINEFSSAENVLRNLSLLMSKQILLHIVYAYVSSFLYFFTLSDFRNVINVMKLIVRDHSFNISHLPCEELLCRIREKLLKFHVKPRYRCHPKYNLIGRFHWQMIFTRHLASFWSYNVIKVIMDVTRVMLAVSDEI